LSAVLLGLLLAYYPVRMALEAWLPAYSEAWSYLVWILPVAVYESRQVLLLNTMLKVLRKERLMLTINLAMLGMAAVLAILSATVVSSLNLAVGSIALLAIARALITELQLGRLLEIRLGLNALAETSVVMAFMAMGALVNPWIGVPLYFALYSVYLWSRRHSLRASVQSLATMVSQ
jgi:hypothetical protein